MKTKFFIPLLFPAILLLVGCEKETTGGVSRITTFPTITLNGDAFVSIGVGEAFTDPGASGKEGTKEAKVLQSYQQFNDGNFTSVSGIDASKPGLFRIKYTAFNVDGFKVESYRWIGIVSAANSSRDFSGPYRRTNGTPVMVTKKGMGMYSIDNVGGVANNPPYVFPFVFYNLDGDAIQGPEQSGYLGNPVYLSKAAVNSAGTQLTWTVMGAGFATNVRTFNKQ